MAKTATLKKSKMDLETIGDEIKVSLPSKAKTTRLQAKAIETLEAAKKLKVANTLQYAQAADFAKNIKETEDTIHELFDEHVADAHQLHKNLTTKRGTLLKPLEEARKTIQGTMSSYDLEQRRLAEQKAQEDAEIERKKLIAQAQRRGDKAEVKELKSLPVVPDEIDIPTPKVQGVVTRETIQWRYVVNDVETLKIIPREYLMIDESKIRAAVKLHGLDLKLAGIEVYKNVQTQIRG